MFLHSSRTIIVAICLLILVGTAFYFTAIKSLFNTNQETKTDELSPKEDYPVIQLPEAIIKAAEGQGKIRIGQAAIFLKTFLKDVDCAYSDYSIFSVSCCGTLPQLQNIRGDSKGCLIIENFENEGSETDTQRIRFIVENNLVIYEQVSGIPTLDTRCIPISEYPGKLVCLSVTNISNEKDVSDAVGYESCTYILAGTQSVESNQLLHKTEKVNCNLTEEMVKEKSMKSATITVIKLKLKSQNVFVISEGKENMDSDFKESNFGEQGELLFTQYEKEENNQVENNARNEEVDLKEGYYSNNQNTEVPEDRNSISPNDIPENYITNENTYRATFPDINITEPPHRGALDFFNNILNFIKDHIYSIFNRTSLFRF